MGIKAALKTFAKDLFNRENFMSSEQLNQKRMQNISEFTEILHGADLAISYIDRKYPEKLTNPHEYVVNGTEIICKKTKVLATEKHIVDVEINGKKIQYVVILEKS